MKMIPHLAVAMIAVLVARFDAQAQLNIGLGGIRLQSWPISAPLSTHVTLPPENI